MVRGLIGAGAPAFVFAALSLTLAEGRAEAAPTANFGDQGQFILGADRLVSLIGFQSNKTPDILDPDHVSRTDSQVSLNFFGSNTGIPGQGSPVSFYNIPRLGFDYTVIPRLTIGGDIMLFTTLGGSTSTTTVNGPVTTTTTVDAPSSTIFGIAPRVGYTFPISDLITFWPRGGLSFWTGNNKATTANSQTTTVSLNQWALDAEGLFVLTPVPHFGITGGPVLDIPLAGSYKVETTRNGNSLSSTGDFSSWNIGLTVGIIGYF